MPGCLSAEILKDPQRRPGQRKTNRRDAEIATCLEAGDMDGIERLCAELFSEANLTARDKLRPLASYGRINGRRRAPDGSRSCLPATGRKRARGVRSDRRRQGRLVPVLTK